MLTHILKLCANPPGVGPLVYLLGGVRARACVFPDIF